MKVECLAMKKFTGASERAPYSRSKHGSFHEEFNVEPPTKKRSSWKRCCCLTLIVVLVILVVLFLIGLTTYLVVKPQYPSVEMSNISIANIKVSPKREGIQLKALLSLNITATLTAVNPNRFRITYRPTETDVSYKELFLGNYTVPAIDQPGRSNYTMPVRLVTDQIDVLQGTGLSLLRDSVNDSVPFTVVGVVRARVHYLGVTSPLLTAKVICDVNVHPTAHLILDRKCRKEKI